MRKKFHAKRAIFIGDCAFGRRPSLQYLDRNEYMNCGIQVGSAIQEYSHGICLHRCNYLKDLGIYAREVAVRWNTGGMDRNEVKRSRNRKAIAVYSRGGNRKIS